MSWGWWGEGRKYEDEYTLARRVGHIVGRKMREKNTKIVKFRVRPDNELANWFGSEFFSYHTAYGGWSNCSARKCFRSELFCGWIQEQLDTDKLYDTPQHRTFKVFRSQNTIMFLNLLDTSRDTYIAIINLAEQLRHLEVSEARNWRVQDNV